MQHSKERLALTAALLELLLYSYKLEEVWRPLTPVVVISDASSQGELFPLFTSTTAPSRSSQLPSSLFVSGPADGPRSGVAFAVRTHMEHSYEYRVLLGVLRVDARNLSGLTTQRITGLGPSSCRTLQTTFYSRYDQRGGCLLL